MRNYVLSDLGLILEKLMIFFAKRNSLELFFILAPIVFLIQLSLLNIILKYGFTADDWLLLFDYRTIGLNNGLFLDKFFSIIGEKGVYTAYQVIYIGFLEGFFKGNYYLYQITNIIFKTLATLSLYPLILVVFKKRLLAFLTTILFAVSYSSTGALQFVVKGSDYLAIFFMNICLVTYYLSFKKRHIFLLYITAILLFLAFMFSPIRIYPFLLFIILVEFFLGIRSKSLKGLMVTLLRLFLLFFLFLIIMLFLAKSTGSYLNGPFVMYRFLTYGNYQLLLSPFAGLGYTFLTNDYWYIFGGVTFDNLRDYLIFLIRGPIIIYTILSILMGFLIFRGKIALRFILGVILTNIIFEIICFFLINNLRGVSGPNVKGFYPISIYAIFLGFYVISIALASFLLWLKNRSDILLLSLFTGPVFSSIFLWGTWFIIGDNLTFKEGVHWYLIIPPIGSSLFLASLMVLGFEKIRTFIHYKLRYIFTICLFLTLIPFYLISSKEINQTFSYLLSIGYGASDQEEIKGKLAGFLKEPLDLNPALIYLDASENDSVDPLFYPVTLISGFGKRMHFRNWEIIDGCIGLISDMDNLKKSVFIEEGVKGFKVMSLCVEDKFFVSNYEVFYKPENFYALKLIGKDVIDNTMNVLDELKY